MSDWDFRNNSPLPLDGEWEFYPGSFEISGTPGFVQVPGDWGTPSGDPRNDSYGFGTYRLRIAVPDLPEEPYTLWIKQVESASVVQINGESYLEFGKPSERKEDYVPKRASYTASYQAAQGENTLEIVIRVSNFDNPDRGGLIKSVKFGTESSIDSVRWYSIGFQMTTFVILLLHGVYAFILFMLDRRQKAFIAFFAMLISAGLSIVVSHDYLLLLWLPVNYTWTVKLTVLSYINLTYFMLMLTRYFAENSAERAGFRVYSWLHFLYCAFVIAGPLQAVHYSVTYKLFILFYVLPVIWFIVLIAHMLLKSRNGAIFLMAAATSVLSSIIWGVFSSSSQVSWEYYPIDILVAIVAFSSYWFKRYMRNAAENNRLNDKLKEADQAKDRFLAQTSHELRTPLHGVINIAQSMALREQGMEERSRKDLELLIKIGKRMSRLVDDLLELTTLKENQIRLYPASLKLNAIIPGIIDMLAYLTEHKQIKLEMAIAEDFPPVKADEKRLIQILFNLIHNAIKYTPAGQIVVSAEVQSGYAKIQVADTGVGIDGEALARIFMPYEQGGTGEGEGFGLGLSICKQLIELHGSKLEVSSDDGKGTVFCFLLPLAPDTQDEVQTEAVAQPEWIPLALEDNDEEKAWSDNWFTVAPGLADGGYRMHLLAVDDDPVNLKVLSGILSGGPYELTMASTGKEALEQLPTRQWDLVISDVMMPYMNGYELTREIRERYSASELPVLLLTARSRPEDIYAGFAAGANDYLTKPVDALELKYRVWSLTTLKRSVTERLRMEAAYLQAQIHPHFLFNTLSSILALSEIDGEKMRSLAEAFTSYLRISFNFLNAGELVPLSHELELVQAYLYIEKERFEERLTIEWEVDREVLPHLPPLSIQPLVENAVKHGLLSTSRGGTIVIRIARRENYVQVDVADNGIGMLQQEADELLRHAFRGGGGIGVANTHRRLTQHYGKGLTIASSPGQGTTVSFSIPDQSI